MIRKGTPYKRASHYTLGLNDEQLQSLPLREIETENKLSLSPVELSISKTPLEGQALTGTNETSEPSGQTALAVATKTEETESFSFASDEEESFDSKEKSPLHVLLITEGTYPFYWGGVSTWCHLLIRDLPEVNFTLFSLVASPHLKPQINLQPNVIDFRPVPLWGVRETLELRQDLALGELLRLKRQTSEELVKNEFVPLLRVFLEELYLKNDEAENLATYIHRMYRFFQEYDFDAVFRSRAVWDYFVEFAQQVFPLAANQHGFTDPQYSLHDISQGLQWLYHWFFPLSMSIPKVDIAHASTAGMATMIAVIAKLEYGAAFLLSEHGIYLRERYLAESDANNTLFLKLLVLRYARRMTELSYVMGDQISPCCDYNQRWEIKNGAELNRLRTIYYGADGDKFYAGGKPVGDPPVVVWVGRINPLKDLFTLLKAAALVHQERPDIIFQLYGKPSLEDQLYYEECLALHRDLGLEGVVKFVGYASNPAVAYNEGDIVLLSSISEGFPFATLEAMLCGKAVVATKVGGLPEQIEGCGIVVEPRNHEEMARAVLELMNDPERCTTYGKAAREKALQEFSVHQSREAYLSSYLRLTGRTMPTALIIHDLLEATTARENSPVEAEEEPYEEACTEDGSEQPQESKALRNITLALQPTGWTPRDLEGMRSLANDISNRDASPVDYLEVAALLETMGNTDSIAFKHFGAPDLFELSKEILKLVRGETQLESAATTVKPTVKYSRHKQKYLRSKAALHKHSRKFKQPSTLTSEAAAAVLDTGPKEVVPDNSSKREAQPFGKRLKDFRVAWGSYAQGAVALFPGLIVLLIIQSYSIIGQWASDQMMAISLGMSAGLLIGSSFLQATMRRASICISLGSPLAAWQFLVRSLGFSALFLLALAAFIQQAAGWAGNFSFQDRLIFSLSFAGLSIIWLAGAPLALVQGQIWLGIALTSGLLVDLAANQITALFTDQHLLVGTVVGFVVTLSLIVMAGWRAFARRIKATDQSPGTFPSTSYMLHEAAPYFGYSLLYVFFISAPHLIGWAGRLDSDQSWLSSITNLEVGLTLSLPPLVLVGGVTERALRLFWQELPLAHASTPGKDIRQFSDALFDFYWAQRERFSVALAVLSLLFGVPFWFILNGGLLQGLIGPNPATAVILFLFGLLTYYLTGQGLFNCTFFVTLSRPTLAMKAVVGGLLVMLALGLPLSLLVNFRLCMIGFLAGAAAFQWLSSKLLKNLLETVDYFYFTAF
ncbi:MAG TPA: GT4 family glycosyltransferase PelF [Chloroflexia bacterium]|nr:GT4 family glycosyltransferase PelF [Chloroflexia bacterium]